MSSEYYPTDLGGSTLTMDMAFDVELMPVFSDLVADINSHQQRCEITINGVRMIVSIMKIEELSSTAQVDMVIHDVLEPPEAREKWLNRSR